MLLRPSLFQMIKIMDSSIAEGLTALVEEAEKEDTKSFELPAMFYLQAPLTITKET